MRALLLFVALLISMKSAATAQDSPTTSAGSVTVHLLNGELVRGQLRDWTQGESLLVEVISKLPLLLENGLSAGETTNDSPLTQPLPSRGEERKIPLLDDSLSNDGPASTVEIEFDEIESIEFRPWSREGENESTAIRLTNQDLIFAEQFSLNDESLIAHFDGQEIVVPTEYVKSIDFRATPETLLHRDPDAPDHDAIRLANGDFVRGTLLSASFTEVTIDSELGTLKLPVESLASIDMNPQLSAAPPSVKERVRVSLQNGSILTASKSRWNAQETLFSGTLVAGDGSEFTTDQLLRLECLGDQFVSLSQVPLQQFGGVDFFGNFIPLRINQNAHRLTILSGQQFFAEGIGVRPRSRLVFKVPLQAAFFTTGVGFDDRVKRVGSVVIAIRHADKVVFQQRFDAAKDSFLSPPPIPVTPGEQLELSVDFGLRSDLGDQINWCRPMFLLDPTRD